MVIYTTIPAVSSTSSFSALRSSISSGDKSPSDKFAPSSSSSSSSLRVVVVVDPYSTGTIICHEFLQRGYPVVAVWTLGFLECTDVDSHLPQALGDKPIAYQAHIHQTAQDTLETVSRRIKESLRPGQQVAACLAGDEFGVDCADQLSDYLGLETSNGVQIPNRRSKKAQQELIHRAGLRSIRQAGGTSLKDPAVASFLASESYPLVVKPDESAGSEGVKLCHTPQEAKTHFTKLVGMTLMNGQKCAGVLCQEFLRGTEYVVDHVSRNGRHVTTAVWVYDKRPANGSAFVYFGLKPVDIGSREAQIIIPYVRQVLDAMEIRHGPSHGEVMLSPGGEPCLVEMNCRAHGGNGNWRALCCALTGGYSQVEVTVDAYLDPQRFDQLPDRPGPYQASGQEVIFVSYCSGTVRSTPGYEMIRSLVSFVSLETSIHVGSKVYRSIDLETAVGSVILMHSDPEVLQCDVDRIRSLERSNGLFVLGDDAGKDDHSALRHLDLLINDKTIGEEPDSHKWLEPLVEMPKSKNSRKSMSSSLAISNATTTTLSSTSLKTNGVVLSHHHQLPTNSLLRLMAGRID